MDQQDRRRILGDQLTDIGDDAVRMHALAEVAFLAAAADGTLADAEIETLVANLEGWLGGSLAPDVLIKLFEHLSAQLAAEGVTARLAAAAATLDDEGRRVAYKLACVTTLCDLEVHDDELGFLGTIADAFGIPQDEAQATFDELDEIVTSVVVS